MWTKLQVAFMRTWIIAVVAGVLCAGSLHVTADPEPNPFRKRFEPEWVGAGGDWTPPALRHGKARVVESRIARPRMNIPIASSDAYRLRIFYIWVGGGPVPVLFRGRKVGELAPASKWSRAVFSTPFVQKETKPVLSFDLPEGGRLLIRRVDYRNYFSRVGTFFAVKPAGGSRAPSGFLWVVLSMSAMIALVGGAAWSLPHTARRDRVARMVWPAGLLALFLLAAPAIFGFSVHAHPAFLAGVYVAVLAVGALPRVRGGWRITLWRLATVAASAVVALAIAEGVLRVWDPPISRPRVRSYSMYSPELGWKNRPGAEGWHVDIGYHIRINRHGHRGPDYPVEKPPGVFRIMGLGNSFTFGWGVNDDQTFMRILERRLRAAGHNVQVLNAGVPAWHSSQSLYYLRKYGVRFQPDLVVMNFFVNDVNDIRLEDLRNGYMARRTRKDDTAFTGKKRNIAGKFRLYNTWFNFRKIRRASKEQYKRNPYPDFESERKVLPRDVEKDPLFLPGLIKVVSGWLRVREELGIPIVFSFLPPGGAIHSPPHQGNNRLLRRISREHNIPFLDLFPIFERHPDPRKLYLHPRDGHMSVAGHALVGEALAKLILKGKWFQKPAGKGGVAP